MNETAGCTAGNVSRKRPGIRLPKARKELETPRGLKPIISSFGARTRKPEKVKRSFKVPTENNPFLNQATGTDSFCKAWQYAYGRPTG